MMRKAIDRSFVTRLLQIAGLCLALMTVGAGRARAETVIGADGADGGCDLGADVCYGGNGESVAASENPATAIGGNGGRADNFLGNFGWGGLGGSARAAVTGSSASGFSIYSSAVGGGGGSSNALSAFGGAGGGATAQATSSSTDGYVSVSASAVGGTGGDVGGNYCCDGGNGGGADATGGAISGGSGSALAAAAAEGGDGGGGLQGSGGGDGGAATATASATALGGGAATANATAAGGAGGALPSLNLGGGGGNGGSATAMSNASAAGGRTSVAKAIATGGAGGAGQGGNGGNGGDATATSDSTALGGGQATATATATGGIGGAAPGAPGAYGAANATSSATTTRGALAQAQSTAVGSSGEAQSTAKTTLAGARVQSMAVARTGGTATTNAIAQGGSGQIFADPGQTAYAFSTGLPDKAYAATLIGGASNVADALLGPRDVVFGSGILGANYASDGRGESDTYSASSTFDFAYRGDLLLGLIDGQQTGFAGGAGFESMEFTIIANGAEILDSTFGSLALAESFFRDDVLDLGSYSGPVDLTIGYNLVADGSGAFGFDFAVGGAVPEPSTWAMMLIGFAGLGFAGSRRLREARRAVSARQSKISIDKSLGVPAGGRKRPVKGAKKSTMSVDGESS